MVSMTDGVALWCWTNPIVPVFGPKVPNYVKIVAVSEHDATWGIHHDGAEADERMRDTLREQGDDGTRSRMVDHIAYFNSQEEAETFVAFLREHGYESEEPDDEFSVSFTRESSVVGDEFESELSALRSKAYELGGQYDGWGCTVVPQSG